MTRMDLDQIGSDVRKRWSPTTSSKDAWNRSHRSSHGSEHIPEIWDTSSRRRERSNDIAVEKYRRENSHRYPKNFELEEGEVLGETKSGIYSTDKLETRDYCQKRHRQRDETDFSDEENHERFNSRRSSHSRDFSKGRDDSRERNYFRRDLNTSFGTREPHRHVVGYNSSPQRTRYGRAGRRSLDRNHVDDAEHDDDFSGNGRLSDRGTIQEARRSSRETNNDLSWNGPKWGEEATTTDAANSSSWKSENAGWPKWEENTTKDTPNFSKSENARENVSWPKWGKQTTENEPNSSVWRSGEVNYACDKEDGNSFLLGGPNLVEETITKGVENSPHANLIADNQGGSRTEKNVFCIVPKSGKEANTKDAPSSPKRRLSAAKWGSSMETEYAKYAPSSWRSSTIKQGPKEGNDWPKWGENTATKDAPNSSQWKSDNANWPKWGAETSEDAPKSSKWWPDNVNQDCKEEAGNSFPLSGPKWGVETDTKGGTNSSQTKSLDDNRGGSNWETDKTKSCIVPKWDKETDTKDAPSSWITSTANWGSRDSNSPKWGNYANTKNAAPYPPQRLSADKWGSSMTDTRGAKWGDEKNAKDAPSSWRSSTKWGSKETNNSSPWNGPNRGDEVPPEDASKPAQWGSADDKSGSNVKTDYDSSWPGPKWRDETNAKDAPLSSRSSATLGSKETTNSLSCSKWGLKENNNSSPWNGPNRGDEAPPKDASKPPQWGSADDKWGSNVKTDNDSSWPGPKWRDETNAKDAPLSLRLSAKSGSKETTNSSSWSDSKWDDKVIAKDPHSFSEWKSDADKWGSTMKIDNNLSWSGPKWGDQTSSDKQASSVEPWKSSWNDRKWGDDRTAEDASMSSRRRSDSYSKRGDQAIKKDFCSSAQHRSDFDKKEYDVRPNNSSQQNEQTDSSARSSHRRSDSAQHDNISSWSGAKWGDRSTVKGTENSSLPKVPKWGDYTSNHKGRVEEVKNDMSWNGPKWVDQAATTDESKPSWPRSDDGNADDCMNTSKSHDRPTTEVSPNFSRQVFYDRINDGVKTDNSLLQNSLNRGDQKVTIDAPKSTHFEQNITHIPSGKDQHSVKISLSPSSNLNLSKQTGQDNRSLKNVEQNQLPPLHEAQNQHTKHSISGNGHDAMPKPPNRQSLKSDRNNQQVGNGASVAMGTAPIATELITSGSSFQNPIIIKESESATSEPCSNDDANSSTELQGEVHHGKQEPKQVELIGDTAMDLTKAETGQSKKENAAANDETGIRMFKFALVEFVKNVLKPSWKEGRLSLEDHRTIVKKVVDKVFGTLPSPNIPRTQKNIELYMSYSKTKLTDLVQAYLELYGKRPAQV